MTPDEAVEVMEDAIAAELQRLVPGCAGGTCSNPAGCGGATCGDAEIYAHHLARAAIRALHAAGGLVLREMPEPISIPDSVDVPKNLTAGGNRSSQRSWP